MVIQVGGGTWEIQVGGGTRVDNVGGSKRGRRRRCEIQIQKGGTNETGNQLTMKESFIFSSQEREGEFPQETGTFVSFPSTITAAANLLEGDG